MPAAVGGRLFHSVGYALMANSAATLSKYFTHSATSCNRVAERHSYSIKKTALIPCRRTSVSIPLTSETPVPQGTSRASGRLVQVFEMEIDDPPFQLFQTLERVQPRAQPVASVGTGPDAFAAALAHLQHGVGVPIVRGVGVVVDGEVDPVLVAKFLDHVEGVFVGSETIVSRPMSLAKSNILRHWPTSLESGVTP